MIKIENIEKFREEYEHMKDIACAALGSDIQDMDLEEIDALKGCLVMCDCAMNLSREMCDTLNHIECMLEEQKKLNK